MPQHQQAARARSDPAQQQQQPILQQMMRGGVAPQPAPVVRAATDGPERPVYVANAAGAPQVNNSPAAVANREGEIRQVIELGFTREQATEAFKRCSTVEAAVDFIINNLT